MAFANIYAGMKFDKTKIVKLDLFDTNHLQFGSLLLEPGQSQAPHTHEASDKVLFVVEGVATVSVGPETMELGPGACALAKAGEMHGLANIGRDRVVMLVATAPPKAKH
ncbi:MAG: cupin domain-containing protein [Candidatus Rokuibacteriota bacterium]